MRLRSSLCLLAAIAAVLGAAASAPASGRSGFEARVRMPNPGVNEALYAVDAIAPDDVWAVGLRSYSSPLLRHWDGTGWNAVAGAGGVKALNAVDALSSTDVWAAGNEGIIHWNGKLWKTSYDPKGIYHIFNSVVAIAEDDAWAVQYDIGPGSYTVHWDGKTWAKVGRLNPDSYYTSIDGDSADDVWAVGTNGFTEHWDGTSWTPYDSGRVSLGAVAVVSPDDVWMAGDDGALPPDEEQAAMLHWDGRDLVSIAIPTPGMASGLKALTVISPTDIWAVGGMTTARGKTRALTEHWDGRHWHIRPTPDLKYKHGLLGVSAVSSDDVYAVGSIREHRFFASELTLHWDGSAWSRMS